MRARDRVSGGPATTRRRRPVGHRLGLTPTVRGARFARPNRSRRNRAIHAVVAAVAGSALLTSMVFPGVRRPAAHPRIRPIVLFIEDDLTLLDLYAMLIEEELGVVKASLGETGYELALSERPDVIVLDLLLPDVDGFTLRERLRLNAATMGIP